MARKPKYKEGDVMRVKENGALVRLIASKDRDDDSLVDDKGYVYVEPVTKIDDWYHIDQLEKP